MTHNPTVDERTLQPTSGPPRGPRLIRVTLPEAVALLGLPDAKALRRLLAAAGVRLRRSGLGDPVIRGEDLRALTAWQPPSERPDWAALERFLRRADGGFFRPHDDLVAEIRRDCPDAERAERTERYAHALLRAVGFGFIEAVPGVNPALYMGPSRGTTRATVAHVHKLITLVQHPDSQGGKP